MELYDSLCGEKKLFQSVHPGKIGLYACGVTVYDECHIGHARGMICFDVLVRWFQSLGYEVNYVRNITDIDDKIIKRSAEKGIGSHELSDLCIASMHRDCHDLGLLEPTHEPRATEYVTEIVALISELIECELAYELGNGDVCFAVAKFPGYGKLSHRSLDQLLAGVRIAVEQEKKDPLDFVLWKRAKPGEPSWDSPWGKGRPGWHIECSAMSLALLGQPFDIHGGGMDLKFPHHENEIAQSEGACQKPYANFWMHIGLVQVDGEKMSKSLGNFFLIQDVLADYSPEVVRYWMLASHYRSPVNYTTANLNQARAALRRLYTALVDLTWQPVDGEAVLSSEQPDIKSFVTALKDDLNTPAAFASLFHLAGVINRDKQAGQLEAASECAGLLAAAGQLLGLLLESPAQFLQGNTSDIDVAAIELLVEKRRQARQNKDWALADDIRDQLQQQGIELDDAEGGTKWYKR